MDRTDRVAIVGASAAGVAGAVALRQTGFDGRITLYDGDPHPPYERPPLSKSLTRPGELPRPIRTAETYRDLAIEMCLGVSVDSLDNDRTVHASDGSNARYDRVLIATGASPRRLDVPGADLDNVLYLRTADDARRIGERLSKGGPLVVIGAGLIGLELAAVARSAGIDVTVVEVAPLPLEGFVGPDVARFFVSLHADHGVRFLVSTSVSELRGRQAVEEVILSGGRHVPAATVVVGIGVVPNDQLVRPLALAAGQGIPVDDYGRTSTPWLWAAGDVAVRRHKRLRRTARIEHWDTAQRHGDAVGQGMAGQLTEECAVPYVWSDQYGLTFQCFGRKETTDRLVVRDGAKPDDFLAFFLEGERVCAVVGVGHPREVRASRGLIESGVRVSDDLLRDPDADLRRPLRAQ